MINWIWNCTLKKIKLAKLFDKVITRNTPWNGCYHSESGNCHFSNENQKRIIQWMLFYRHTFCACANSKLKKCVVVSSLLCRTASYYIIKTFPHFELWHFNEFDLLVHTIQQIYECVQKSVYLLNETESNIVRLWFPHWIWNMHSSALNSMSGNFKLCTIKRNVRRNE